MKWKEQGNQIIILTWLAYGSTKIGWLVLKTKYFNTAAFSDVVTVFAYKVLMK
jgi:hypothetical protein